MLWILLWFVLRDAPDDDADWRDIPEWESWLECIDGNEKELHCKSCKLNVVALKSFVVKHAHSRLHSLRMNVVDHSPEAIELVETVEPPKDANSSPGRTKRIIATKQYTQRVRHVWKSQPKFESWLQIFDDDDSRVQCKFCDMEMSAKKSVLQKHGQSKKHIENMNVAYKSIDDNTSQIGIDAAWLCPHCQSGFCDEKLLKVSHPLHTIPFDFSNLRWFHPITDSHSKVPQDNAMRYLRPNLPDSIRTEDTPRD